MFSFSYNFYLFLEYGCLGHPGIGSTYVPKMIEFFYKNNIKIKDIACGMKFNIVLAGKIILINKQ